MAEKVERNDDRSIAFSFEVDYDDECKEGTTGEEIKPIENGSKEEMNDDPNTGEETQV
jgi:hypothetical protein